MSNKKEDAKDYVDLSRAEMFDELVHCGALTVMAAALNIKLTAITQFLEETKRQTREMRIQEAMDLIARGVCIHTAACFSRVGTGELLGASQASPELAPRLSEKDRAADAAHIARWGHV